VTPSPTPTRIEEPRLDLGPEPSMLPDLDERDDSFDLRSSRDRGRDAASTATATAMAITRSRGAASRAVPIGAGANVDVESHAETHAAASTASHATAANRDLDLANLAPLGTRVSAGLIDILFMAAVDALVLHFTLRVAGIPYHDIRRLPLLPLIAFCALLNGGYLTMFTAAAGQTMGKMLMGVKVVTSRGGPVPFGSAVVRASAAILTILPAGVGFIPALLTSDRRALHDRFADTKVIKTSD
jgi:uncharacterized RDD family membrane protein YckC